MTGPLMYEARTEWSSVRNVRGTRGSTGEGRGSARKEEKQEKRKRTVVCDGSDVADASPEDLTDCSSPLLPLALRVVPRSFVVVLIAAVGRVRGGEGGVEGWEVGDGAGGSEGSVDSVLGRDGGGRGEVGREDDAPKEEEEGVSWSGRREGEDGCSPLSVGDQDSLHLWLQAAVVWVEQRVDRLLVSSSPFPVDRSLRSSLSRGSDRGWQTRWQTRSTLTSLPPSPPSPPLPLPLPLSPPPLDSQTTGQLSQLS